MNTMNSYRRGQLGFTIVEALVALVIMGFGILSLAGMQAMLSRNADDAKQRTEAVRLAQEKIEQLRSYTGIASTLVGQGVVSSTALNWNALAGSTDTISTNTTYTRTWTLGGASADPMRALTVNVGWIDRAGAAQTVALSSVLAKVDPADSGFLGFPLPLNTTLKRPKNRSLDIPIPAISLNNGQSAVRFGNTNQFVVFSDISGDVVKLCTPTGLSGTPTDAQIVAALTSADAGTNGCQTINGYIVAGYVGMDSSSMSLSEFNSLAGGMDINTSAITRNAAGNTGITCKFGDAKDQNTGASIDGFKYYICVIPLAAPTPALTVNGPYNWSGTIRLEGPSAWHSSGNRYYVCRYQYVATSSLTDVNQRNVQPYVQVNRSLDQQNYVIAMTNNATSTTTPQCPDITNKAGVSLGVLHQDCRSASNPTGFAAACPLKGATTSYTLTYHDNGASSGTVPTDPFSPYSAGATVTVLGNTGNLARSGYYFGGWSTTADGSGTAYTAGSSFAINANTTLYAKWTVAPTYTVRYDNNNGNGTVNDPNTYLGGATATVLSGTALSKTCNDFTGWNTAANGSGTPYAAGASLTVNSNVTLYAQWALRATYTVAYNANGAPGITMPTDPNSPYCAGSTVTVLAATDPSRTGYRFDGWNTAADGTGTNFAVGATFAISGNTTLYAKWTARYTVTYDSSGGTGSVPASAVYDGGSTVTVASSPSPTRSGYVFKGWSLTNNGTVVTTFTINSNTTLYAKWSILDTPVPSWPYVPGSNNDPLGWLPISDATSYKIRTCTTPANGSCSPTNLATTTTATSYTQSVSNNTALCITVTATNGTTESSASATKCVSRTGGTYIHY